MALKMLLCDFIVIEWSGWKLAWFLFCFSIVQSIDM